MVLVIIYHLDIPPKTTITQAYEELKAETSKKKNLWDKFLDNLAGGIQKTPAQRVILAKWVEGGRTLIIYFKQMR